MSWRKQSLKVKAHTWILKDRWRQISGFQEVSALQPGVVTDMKPFEGNNVSNPEIFLYEC